MSAPVHKCSDGDCPYFGTPSPKSCGCHVTPLAMLERSHADLLAALRDATDFVDDAVKQWPVGSLELENARVVRERIEAAIAKATGQ